MKKILTLIAITLGLALGGALQARAQVAVVVHPAVPSTAVEASTLLDIYTLDKSKWDDGSRIVPLSLDSEADSFYGSLGRSHSNLRKVWLRKKLSGEGQPPESLADAAALLQKVAATPGAVGFVPASAVDESVKVVATLQ